MARKQRKQYDDDDGRTIVDMSGVTRPNLWSFRFPGEMRDRKNGKDKEDPREKAAKEAAGKADPFHSQLTKEDRRAYILVAIGSALGIAAVFGVVFAIAIIIIGHAHC